MCCINIVLQCNDCTTQLVDTFAIALRFSSYSAGWFNDSARTRTHSPSIPLYCLLLYCHVYIVYPPVISDYNYLAVLGAFNKIPHHIYYHSSVAQAEIHPFKHVISIKKKEREASESSSNLFISEPFFIIMRIFEVSLFMCASLKISLANKSAVRLLLRWMASVNKISQRTPDAFRRARDTCGGFFKIYWWPSVTQRGRVRRVLQLK